MYVFAARYYRKNWVNFNLHCTLHTPSLLIPKAPAGVLFRAKLLEQMYVSNILAGLNFQAQENQIMSPNDV